MIEKKMLNEIILFNWIRFGESITSHIEWNGNGRNKRFLSADVDEHFRFDCMHSAVRTQTL